MHVTVSKEIEEQLDLTGMEPDDWFLFCKKCLFQMSKNTAMQPMCPNCGTRLLIATVREKDMVYCVGSGVPRWLNEWLKINSSPEGYKYVCWYLDHNVCKEISACADRLGHSVSVDGIVIWQQDYDDLVAVVARGGMEGDSGDQ